MRSRVLRTPPCAAEPPCASTLAPPLCLELTWVESRPQLKAGASVLLHSCAWLSLLQYNGCKWRGFLDLWLPLCLTSRMSPWPQAPWCSLHPCAWLNSLQYNGCKWRGGQRLRVERARPSPLDALAQEWASANLSPCSAPGTPGGAEGEASAGGQPTVPAVASSRARSTRLEPLHILWKSSTKVRCTVWGLGLRV